MIQHGQPGAEMRQLLTKADVAARLKLSQRTISRMLSAGEFPRPVRLGRGVRWRESDIDDFIDRSIDQKRH